MTENTEEVFLGSPKNPSISNEEVEGAISNATPEGKCPVDTPDDDVASTDEESDQEIPESDDEQDTFPREYVEKLRDENARYRQRAGQADDLAAKLHTALVTATGKLMDPSDIEFDESHLDDPEKLTAAIDELLEAKPYLGKRTPKGDIGQGASGASETVDLAGMLRSRA